MFTSKMVRISPEFRVYWGKDLGQWFYIQSINDDKTARICSNSTHQIFCNAPIKELRP